MAEVMKVELIDTAADCGTFEGDGNVMRRMQVTPRRMRAIRNKPLPPGRHD